MPQLGESIAEATIIRFNVAVGDTVEADQEIIEVETNKATMCVTTLCGGVIKEVFAEEGVSYAVGSILGTVDATDEEIERTGVSTVREGVSEAKEEQSRHSDEEEENLHFKTEDGGYFEPKDVNPSVTGLPVPAGQKGAHYISPRMRARMNELGLQAADISAIAGSGGGGRVTVEDLEKFLNYISEWPSSPASPMRLAVADAMRRSWTRPLATVGHPVVMDKLLDHRRSQNPKPGLTLYVLRAFAIALAENNLYIENLKHIIQGNVIELNDEAVIDSAANYEDIKNEPIEADSILRNMIETEEKYNLFNTAGSTPGNIGSFIFLQPLKGTVTSRFNIKTQHFGIDVVAPKNEAIKATLDGTVIFAEWTVETGYVIQLQHADNIVSIYKHNSVLHKKVGDYVKAGEVIAIVGNSGELSSGPHLHFELWYNGMPINPEDYMMF